MRLRGPTKSVLLGRDFGQIGYQGVGREIVAAIGSTDFYVVQAGVIILALIFASLNLLIDLTYLLIDPASDNRVPAPAVGAPPRPRRSAFWPRLLHSKAATISAIVFLVVVIAALAAPWLSPADPSTIKIIQRLKPPGYTNSAGTTFWLGTDALGRDVLSRVIFGALVSLTRLPQSRD